MQYFRSYQQKLYNSVGRLRSSIALQGKGNTSSLKKTTPSIGRLVVVCLGALALDFDNCAIAGGGLMKIPILAAVICALSLSACTTLEHYSETQNNASKFDQGAHLVSVAEMAFLRQVQKAECTRDFYEQAYRFATAQGKELDLTLPCSPRGLTNDELELRQKLVDAVALYADSLTAITGRTNERGLESNSSILAKNIQSLASQQKFAAVSTNGVAALNTAAVSIAEFVIDHHEYLKIGSGATDLQKPLKVVVDELKSENIDDAQGLASNFGTVSNEFRLAVIASRNKRGAASLLDIYEARTALKSIAISPSNVAQLNAALDALLSANQALADPNSRATTSKMSLLISRARQAVALFNSSK